MEPFVPTFHSFQPLLIAKKGSILVAASFLVPPLFFSFYLLLIRQKGESQNGCFKKTKHAKFSQKRISGGKKCSFFGKFGVLCFLETPVLRFTLLPHITDVIWNKYDLNVQQSCRLHNIKYMIASIQITNTELSAFIAVLVFKLLSRNVFL